MFKNRILFEKKMKQIICDDLGFGDITTFALIDEELYSRASVVCKEHGVVAGVEEASQIFKFLGCEIDLYVKDGDVVNPDFIILKVSGPSRAILQGERTALNILTRMSGIATVTWRLLSKARKVNSKIRIAATRKTAPGLRYFDKRAVMLGGGDTHRLRLDDCILIKDNHLVVVGSITEAVKRARETVSFTKKLEIEVESLDQAVEAAEAGADIIMLDNMKPMNILLTIKELKKRGLRKKVLIEASGEITETNIRQYASTGVDIISMGSLTHSVKAINISLNVLYE